LCAQHERRRFADRFDRPDALHRLRAAEVVVVGFQLRKIGRVDHVRLFRESRLGRLVERRTVFRQRQESLEANAASP